MSDALLERALCEGAIAHGVDLTPAQCRRLLSYVELLGKWGRVYNLTAIRSPQEILDTHILDSIALVRPLLRHMEFLATEGVSAIAGIGQAARPRPLELLDVGSGAGLPGVVLAICVPAIQVTCVDAAAKKAAFVRQFALAERCENLQSLHARVEELSGAYAVITSRAFASLADFVRVSAHLLAAEGVWVAMKGRMPDAELTELGPAARVFHVEPLDVPGKDRCLVWMKPAEDPSAGSTVQQQEPAARRLANDG